MTILSDNRIYKKPLLIFQILKFPAPFYFLLLYLNLHALIVPNNYTTPKDFICVGELTRVECDKLVIGYEFNLTTNKMVTNVIENPNAGQKHHFKALRHISQANKAVTMK